MKSAVECLDREPYADSEGRFERSQIELLSTINEVENVYLRTAPENSEEVFTRGLRIFQRQHEYDTH